MWESMMYLLIGNNEKSDTQLKENKQIKTKKNY